MISKQEIISMSRTLDLLPSTVEKDYVLSWVLQGISEHSKLSEWLFKGGTCLKKCYFETYRFSEDLDFTAPADSIYDKDDIKNALADVANIVYEKAGINLVAKEIEVIESINKKKHITYIAKLTYLGPLNLPSRNQQRVKFDITDDEVIIDSPDMREVFHPYSDMPSWTTKVRCYSINEILAEKSRAIFERQGRARDIYDVVNISRNFRDHVDINKTKDGLNEKFKFKSLPAPSVDLIFSQIDFLQLKANWDSQLRHQLQVLPSVESFYNELQTALSWWLDEHYIEPQLTAISNKTEEESVPRVHFPEESLQLQKRGTGRQLNLMSSSYLDKIRYAARNRLCIEIEYKGVQRLVEPYSIRLAKTGNMLLYVYQLKKAGSNSSGPRDYKISEITAAKVTSLEFSPKYIVEL